LFKLKYQIFIPFENCVLVGGKEPTYFIVYIFL